MMMDSNNNNISESKYTEMLDALFDENKHLMKEIDELKKKNEELKHTHTNTNTNVQNQTVINNDIPVSNYFTVIPPDEQSYKEAIDFATQSTPGLMATMDVLNPENHNNDFGVVHDGSQWNIIDKDTLVHLLHYKIKILLGYMDVVINRNNSTTYNANDKNNDK